MRALGSIKRARVFSLLFKGKVALINTPAIRGEISELTDRAISVLNAVMSFQR